MRAPLRSGKSVTGALAAASDNPYAVLMMKAASSENTRERVLVALSGGVDSAVAALLLQRAGCDVHAAYMKNWMNEVELIGDCPWQRDIEDARAVADRLRLPFRVINVMRDYRRLVVEYLLREYAAGVTPNPDVMCNRFIKFGLFRDLAKREGFDAVGTGHYARRRPTPDGADILTGVDSNKDQTYFLALMSGAQADDARFPIGDLRKDEVRALARGAGLPNADKKDSQGICFVGNIRMKDFLGAFLEDRPGPILDLEGRERGRHRGLHYFTLGQRHGLGIASAIEGEHYVVVRKDRERNALIIGLDRPETPGLYRTDGAIGSLHFIRRRPDGPFEGQARPRYRCPSQDALVTPLGNDRARITFRHPQRALTPGQICALYDGDVLLGGGIFEEVIS
jgi:tRNA-uridine 2-sulfurtransferase